MNTNNWNEEIEVSHVPFVSCANKVDIDHKVTDEFLIKNNISNVVKLSVKTKENIDLPFLQLAQGTVIWCLRKDNTTVTIK